MSSFRTTLLAGLATALIGFAAPALAGNSAFITQTGPGNDLAVHDQSGGNGNYVNSSQDGIGHSANVTQVGGANFGNTIQTGNGNSAGITQVGDLNIGTTARAVQRFRMMVSESRLLMPARLAR